MRVMADDLLNSHPIAVKSVNQRNPNSCSDNDRPPAATALNLLDVTIVNSVHGKSSL
jgi:hypothetical protein